MFGGAIGSSRSAGEVEDSCDVGGMWFGWLGLLMERRVGLGLRLSFAS